ncbi:hypothetical protein M514_02517 [Trichuris suis]|uniref:EB domain-containing protein n=1 Tax=Trichuris suis TaxID=68888 RepID=A0A085NN95_9BILA|nr:hypothetical protein M514_02517 [Trichuris suis]
MLTSATLVFTLYILSRTRNQVLSQEAYLTTCNDHDDCQDQSLCSNGVCELAIPTYKGCESDNDCGQNSWCMYGLCWILRGNLCPEGQVLYTGGYNQCKILPEESKKDSACPNGYYCNELNGYCCSTSTMTSLGGNCTTSKCEDPNAYCISGICTCRPGFSNADGICIREGKQLHQACTLDVECEVPYSRCQNETCECPNGFHEENANCKPSSKKKLFTFIPGGAQSETSVGHFCPFGQPVVHFGKVLECKVTKFLLSQHSKSKRHSDHSIVKRTTSAQQYYMDSCPSFAYCVTYGSPTISDSLSNSIAASGYCCPKLKNNCPVGVEVKIPKGIPCQLACPMETHFCFLTQHEPISHMCCPMPCMKDEYYTDGKCVQQKAIGQSCSSDKECLSHNSKCLTRDKHATCWCEKDEVQYKGNCMIPTCPNGTPMRDKAGNYIRCTVHCPSKGSFCHDQFQICCPQTVK